ncbi:MAG: nodulation protein NfeD [Firmicutes bacterium]|nr:nodulation protein NfeD [Bacillota bacterium]
MLKRLLLVFLLLLLAISPLSSLPDKDQPVDVLVLSGAILPITATYVIRGIDQAERDNAICVIQMDTPGGLSDSMDEIIKKINSSTVPVVVYVYPHGARAASAGTYIMYAAHVAAMCPVSNMGSAHPVFIGGGGSSPGKEDEGKDKKEKPKSQDEIMSEKVTNDAVAKIKSLAEKRHRNAQWAEKAVRESVNITASEALKLNVIDLVAENMDDLLKKLDGRVVELPNGKVTLHPGKGPYKTIPMSSIESFLAVISNPSIALVLMSIGSLALIYELASPGAILPGIVGVICLILAFYSLGSLPINYAGLGLVIFSLILFIADVFATSHGFLTAGGIISFILGASMLIPAGYPYLSVSWYLIGAMALTMGGFFGFVITMVIKAQRKKSITGREGLVGSLAEARTDLSPEGTIFLMGELWRARSVSGTISKGSLVKVKTVKGLRVTVEPAKEEDK